MKQYTCTRLSVLKIENLVMWIEIVISIKPSCGTNRMNISCFESFVNIFQGTSVAILVDINQKIEFEGLNLIEFRPK